MTALYFTAGLISLTGTWILTPAVIKLVRRLKVLDQPDERKIHTTTVPRGGGLSFALLLPAILAGSFFLPTPPAQPLLLPMAVSLLVIAAAGFVDDLIELPPAAKLLAQLAAAAIFVLSAPGPGSGLLETIGVLFWLVLLMNAFNLIDGLDGLAISLAAVAAAGFFALGLLYDLPAAALPAALLFGAAIGFLPYNRFPAKVFMGDTGSLCLGLALGETALALTGAPGATAGSVSAAALFVALPLFDTVLSVIRRIKNRKPLFFADKAHFYNLLMDRGFSHPQTVVLCTGLAAVLTFSGIGAAVAVRGPQVAAICAGAVSLLAFLTIKWRLLST